MNIQTVSYSEDDYVTPLDIAATTTAFFEGNVDLDPASSETANSVVQADRYFSWRENGLNQVWRGKSVYLFPPKNLLNGDEQPHDPRLFTKKLRFKKSAQRVWLELCYKKWLRNEFEHALIFLTSAEVALLVTQKIKFDFPLCVLADRPKLLREKSLKPLQAKVLGFIYYLPTQSNYDQHVGRFIDFYSNLGRVYA